MKNIEIKQQKVEQLKSMLGSAGIVIVTHNKGINAAQARDLRRKMRQAGSNYLVEKNTLVKRALEGTDFSGLADLMSGPTALTYSEDAVSAAKTIHEFSKQSEKIEILGGVMNGTVLDTKVISTLAALPSLDELRAKIIALLNAPATKLAQVVQAPASQVARVVSAYANK